MPMTQTLLGTYPVPIQPLHAAAAFPFHCDLSLAGLMRSWGVTSSHRQDWPSQPWPVSHLPLICLPPLLSMTWLHGRPSVPRA